MGIIMIALVDEHGAQTAKVEADTHLLDDLLPAYDDRAYQCLRFIDIYGDTVFNRLQMKDVAIEWERIAAASGSPVAPLFGEVRELIERCAHEPHTYLKFFGD